MGVSRSPIVRPARAGDLTSSDAPLEPSPACGALASSVRYRHAGAVDRGFAPPPMTHDALLTAAAPAPAGSPFAGRTGATVGSHAAGGGDEDPQPQHSSGSSPTQAVRLPAVGGASRPVGRLPSSINLMAEDAAARLAPEAHAPTAALPALPSPIEQSSLRTPTRKLVRVARIVDEVSGAVTWEDTEVRYGVPKSKPFALNCTFGLPRVKQQQQQQQQSHHCSIGDAGRHAAHASFAFTSSSSTPGPHARDRLGGPAPGPAGSGSSKRSSKRSSPHDRKLNRTPANAELTAALEAAERAARDLASFEDFVRPRDTWPASEGARLRVPPVATVVRARRRLHSGDSTSDSDDEVDPSDVAQRLQKLLQRQQRMQRRGAKAGGGGAVTSGRNNAPSAAASSPDKSVLSTASPPLQSGTAPPAHPAPLSASGLPSPTKATKRLAPASAADPIVGTNVAGATLQYELEWAREQLRRAHERDREAS
jgi:hypothetical protein